MKTLDEVLEAIKTKSALKLSSRRKDDRWVVPIDLFQEIIYYLKEYQRDKQIYSYDIARRNFELAERNDPLTWKELRSMEGMPVWVELLKGKWKGWDVIGGFDEDDFGIAMVTVRGDDYYKLDLGKTWQAYRKERE